MNWPNIAAICLVAYLVVAIPVYYLNEIAIEECRPVCSSLGYDSAIYAMHEGGRVRCRCFDSNSRVEEYVWKEVGK